MESYKLGNCILLGGFDCRSLQKVLDIAEYVCKMYCKEMRTLIKDGKECPPKMPKKPSTGKQGVDEIDIVMFKSDYDRYRDKTEEMSTKHRCSC